MQMQFTTIDDIEAASTPAPEPEVDLYARLAQLETEFLNNRTAAAEHDGDERIEYLQNMEVIKAAHAEVLAEVQRREAAAKVKADARIKVLAVEPEAEATERVTVIQAAEEAKALASMEEEKIVEEIASIDEAKAP
jgi:putative intracellular protease/amidase